MLNNCSFVGRFTKDQEVKVTQSGVSYVNFSLAVERNYAADGSERITDFLDFKAWRGTAEFIGKWFKKGSWIAIEGEMQTSTYQAEDGSNKKSVYCLVRQASFAGSAGSAQAKPQEQQSHSPVSSDQFQTVSEEDCPF